MLAPLLALALCILASLSGAVLAQPVLTACGVPPGVLRLVPTLLFACLLVPPVLLSGDWLWMNGKRRSGPPRGQILARLAIMTALLALVGPLTLTERPMSEIASSARALAGTWTNDGPVELEKSARTVVTPAPDPTILPTPADAQFPTAPVVLEAQPLRVIEMPTGPELSQAPVGTFFVYEWKDTVGTTHWCNVFEEIPVDGRVLKATVMKPIEPRAPPTWALSTSVPRANEPVGRSFMNDPMLPSYAETHWRSQFRQMHTRIREQERKITAKQKLMDEGAALLNRRAMEDELRGLKNDLKDLQQEDNDLEREASYRAVPREWRN